MSKNGNLHIYKLDINENEIIYEQVAKHISGLIKLGTIKPSDKLPSENELSKYIGVSRGSLRKAIDLLVDQNLLFKVHGKGTFVNNFQNINFPFAQEFISYEENMKRLGINFTTKVLHKEIIKPSKEIRLALKTKKDDVIFYLKRIRFVENEPEIILHNWINITGCEEFPNLDFVQVGLFNAIENFMKQPIKFGIRDFTAVLLEEKEANILNLTSKNPVMKLTQHSYDYNDHPIEYSEVYLRSDKYKISSIIER
jgi:DNA-binding GntR family transcriptional regulator